MLSKSSKIKTVISKYNSIKSAESLAYNLNNYLSKHLVGYQDISNQMIRNLVENCPFVVDNPTYDIKIDDWDLVVTITNKIKRPPESIVFKIQTRYSNE